MRNGNIDFGVDFWRAIHPLESSYEEWKPALYIRLNRTVNPLESSYEEWKLTPCGNVPLEVLPLESSYEEWKPLRLGQFRIPRQSALESSYEEWKRRGEGAEVPDGALLNLPMRNGNQPRFAVGCVWFRS